jgi:uncharacterized protein (TIGR03083 family)
MMDVDTVWRHIHTEREHLTRVLAELPAEGWDHPTLCTGWAVRHVAAHVISSAEASAGDVLAMMWRGQGNFNRALYREGLRLGSRSPDEILDAFERNRGSRHHPLGTTRWEPLLDALVHTQDIVLPLGLNYTMPIEAAQVAADRVWSWPFPFFARRRLGRVRLIADDTEWRAGSGAEIRGPMASLLLLLTGRDAAFLQLRGEGLALLPHR